MARFFNNQKEIDELSKQWELHLSGFNKPIQFINNQKPKYYSKEYKNSLFMSAEDNGESLGYESTHRGAVECFVVGC